MNTQLEDLRRSKVRKDWMGSPRQGVEDPKCKEIWG